jgi:NAD dependent epimerase/dehydratase
MEKILVTGAGGFIGSHLTEYLVEQGHRIKAFIHYNSRNFWGWLEKSKYINDIEIYSGDIRDYDSVYKSMKGIDYVFHLAALIGIPYSYYSPLAYIKTNIEGTYNILQSAKELGTKRIIHTSTSEVYGTAQYIPMNENHPINPQSPYAATKASADYLAKSFYLSFDFPVTIVRPFNTFGPRQSARAVIPTIITQILNDKKVIKLGNLNSSRDFTYVLDTVEAMYKIGLNDKTNGEVINIGNGRDVSIYETASIINKLIHDDININAKIEIKRVRPDKSEVQRLVSDYSKAHKLTGWKPRYTLEEGLEKTIAWFRENLNIYKEGIYNV